MIHKTTVDTPGFIPRLRLPGGYGRLLDILIAFLPLAILGLMSDQLGGATEFGQGVLITLAYGLSLLVATLVLRARGTGWRAIGLARPESWSRTALWGLALAVAVAVALLFIQVAVYSLPGMQLESSDQSQYNPLAGNLPLLLFMVVAAWTSIAFGEEMFFRAFLITSLAYVRQGSKVSWAVALVISSAFFGLAHYQWGLAGVIETGIFGLILGTAYLRSGRNLWIPIIAHGLLNTVKFLLIYGGIA